MLPFDQAGTPTARGLGEGGTGGCREQAVRSPPYLCSLLTKKQPTARGLGEEGTRGCRGQEMRSPPYLCSPLTKRQTTRERCTWGGARISVTFLAWAQKAPPKIEILFRGSRRISNVVILEHGLWWYRALRKYSTIYSNPSPPRITELLCKWCREVSHRDNSPCRRSHCVLGRHDMRAVEIKPFKDGAPQSQKEARPMCSEFSRCLMSMPCTSAAPMKAP